MKKWLIVSLGVVVLVVVAFMLFSTAVSSPTESPTPIATAMPRDLRAVADEMVNAIKVKDWEKVSTFASDNVRFSPYGYIDTKSHLSFPPKVIKEFPLISAAYTWGNYDGSGEPIVLGTGAYYEKFIYDKNYANATQVIENRTDSRGNTINNLKEVYPNAQWVEYYLQGSEQYNGMDWGSLILVFDQQNGQWKLVGIVHDQWTI